jgi:hypothetical protein
MNMTDWNDDTNEGPTPAQAGLEQLARQLDAQAYPGQAWPPAARLGDRSRAGRSAWWVAAVAVTAAAVALTFAAIFGLGRRPDTPVPPSPGTQQDLVRASGVAAEQTGDDTSPPCVFVVEDLDSYSIIDATSEVAVVLFATKDGSGPVWLVAVPPSSPPPAAAKDC